MSNVLALKRATKNLNVYALLVGRPIHLRYLSCGNMEQQRTLNMRGKIFDLDQPRVMGIINITPDSFFAGSRSTDASDILTAIRAMINDGVDIIDVGASSSRPGSEMASADEEIERLLPFFEAMKQLEEPCNFAIDTVNAKTAETALEHGFVMVNDVSGGRFDPDIAHVAAGANAPFICMHMQGSPSDMQYNPQYSDVVYDILRHMVERISTLQQAGIRDIVIDPGFGFGKTLEHNYTLLQKLGVFRILERPIMVGLSRKSMIWRPLNITANEALNGTTALHMIALQKGASILRVHDVRPAKEAIKLFELLKQSE